MNYSQRLASSLIEYHKNNSKHNRLLSLKLLNALIKALPSPVFPPYIFHLRICFKKQGIPPRYSGFVNLLRAVSQDRDWISQPHRAWKPSTYH